MIDFDAGGVYTAQELVNYLIDFTENRQPSCECGELHGTLGTLEEEEAKSLEIRSENSLEWYLDHEEDRRAELMSNGRTLILTPDAEVAHRWRISAYEGQTRLVTVYVDDRFDRPNILFDDIICLSAMLPGTLDPFSEMYKTWDFGLLTESLFEKVAQDLALVVRAMRDAN